MTAVQDFSVPEGDAMDVLFTVDPTDQISLVGATVTWSVYVMSFGVPDPSQLLLAKTSATGGVTILESPGQFLVHLAETDTALPPGNYYHEAEVVDASENHATVCQGSMTTTLALIP